MEEEEEEVIVAMLAASVGACAERLAVRLCESVDRCVCERWPRDTRVSRLSRVSMEACNLMLLYVVPRGLRICYETCITS